MATAIQSNFRIRKNLGRISRVIEVPNLTPQDLPCLNAYTFKLPGAKFLPE